MKKIGMIISNSNTPDTFNFYFQIEKNCKIHNNDFVAVNQGEDIIVGKISNLTTTNEMFSDSKILRYYQDHSKDIQNFYSFDPLRIGNVKILGTFHGESLNLTTIPPLPGQDVYELETHIISLLLKTQQKGLHLGSLQTNTDISISLDPNKLLSYHFAVLGATGSGKSYTNGVLIEEILRFGIPIIIFDPHGEYRNILIDENIHSLPDNREILKNLLVFKNNLSNTEREELESHNISINEISFKISEIPSDYLSELLNCTEIQSDLLVMTIQKLLKLNTDISIFDLISEIETYGKEQKFNTNTINAVIRRLNRLDSLGMIGPSISIQELVKKRSITVVDLSDSVDDFAQRVSLAILLVKLFQSAKMKKIPPSFIMVEEAHIFAPQNFESVSKFILRKISREGRKFGLGLNITSQRIIGIDKDILSQCNTKIILRIDSKTDLDYLLPYISSINTRIEKIIPNLPEGVAFINGYAIGLPSIIKIRKRITKHGGETPAMY